VTSEASAQRSEAPVWGTEPLPMTDAGKIAKHALRAAWLAQS
jgi:hypothetical protein